MAGPRQACVQLLKPVRNDVNNFLSCSIGRSRSGNARIDSPLSLSGITRDQSARVDRPFAVRRESTGAAL